MDKILYIDDEKANLISFKALFRRNYDVYLALNENEALSIIQNEEDLKVVICDQKLKDTSGVLFLTQIKKLKPDTVRIIITGFEDVTVMTAAINEAEVFRFISKPWNELDFQNTIEKAVELHNYKHQLKRQNIQLKKAYSELTKFVYSASHDMRAPLTSVLGLIELAKEDPLFSKDKLYLPNIEKSILRLDDFVRNVVEYYQNREKSPDITVINLEELISECFHKLKTYNPKNKVAISIDINHTRSVYSDAFRLQIILSNLISNGLKYQRVNNNSKYVNVSTHDTERGVLIDVKDNGIGIQEPHLPKLFDMFFRATTLESGSGIGLYIVKEAIEAINGTISVSSKINAGTTFRIFIPDLKN